jgi:hypothetical protein
MNLRDKFTAYIKARAALQVEYGTAKTQKAREKIGHALMLLDWKHHRHIRVNQSILNNL